MALTFDRASGVLTLFLNGACATSGNRGQFAAPPLTAADVYLGFRPGAESFKGLLDEPTIYNRALTVDEIFSIYSADVLGKDTSNPYFTSSPLLPDAALATAYQFSFAAALGTPPIGFSLSGGALPPGLSLSNAGLVSGSPTTVGFLQFTVRATDHDLLYSELSCSLSVVDSVSAPAGLVGWWKAEGDAKDVTDVNAGALLGGVGFAAGKVGQAFNFPGSAGDAVKIPASPTLNAGGGAGFTLELWVNPADTKT